MTDRTPDDEKECTRRQIAPSEVMEVIADVLLACCAGRDPDCPTYTERQLSRKSRRAASIPESFAFGTADAASGILLDAEIALLTDQTRMPPLEMAAWRLHVAGHRPYQIAEKMGVTRPTAARLLRSARRRVAVAHPKYEGLHSVYRGQTNRYVYRKPGHCDQRYCARLGYCRFALRGCQPDV